MNIHIVNNLNMEKTITEQLDGYAVATNLLNPEPEHFVYAFTNLKDGWSRGFIHGMANAIDALSNYIDEYDFEECSVLHKITAEIKNEAIRECIAHLVSNMDDALIALDEEENDE